MGIIEAGLGVSKTIRNVGRLREIVTIFAKYGFAEFLTHNITSVIPDFVLPKSIKRLRPELEKADYSDIGLVIANRLRKCFEELGPVFVKFGQLLSSRDDIFDESFVREMSKLKDAGQDVEYHVIKEVIESAYSKEINNVFKDFNPIAIGNASVGVVYKATMANGRDVVVKVRRPGIEKLVETDLSILKFLIVQIEKMSEDIQALGISKVVNDFFIRTNNELNFYIEAQNNITLSSKLSKHSNGDLFYIPEILSEYTRENIIVMEYIDGIKLSDYEKIAPVIPELRLSLEKGVSLFLKSFLQDGIFHADLHEGNLFFLNDKRIALIDFGLMGQLSKKSRINFISIIYALVSHNYENLVYEFLDVADFNKVPDIDEVVSDFRDSLAPFLGLSISQMNISKIFKVIVSSLVKHKLYLPREWYIIFRALITMDGVARKIGIDINLLEILNDIVKDVAKNSFSKEELIEELIWTGKDIVSNAKLIPRHIKWYVKEWAKKGYSFEVIHSGHEKDFKRIYTAISFLGISILTSVFILSGTLALNITSTRIGGNPIPILSYILWAMGGVVLLGGRIIFK